MLDLGSLQRLFSGRNEGWGVPVKGFDLGGRPFDFNSAATLVGVINLSLDSGYRESICRDEAEAVARGLELTAQGAGLVDIGAESTLPHAERVSPARQIECLVPVVEQLTRKGVLVSAESYHPEVLEAAGKAGARVFNLTGHLEEREILKLARHFEAAVIFCYVQGRTPHDVGSFTFAPDMMAEMEQEFGERTARAAQLGVNRCILDPGLGFYYANLHDGNLRVNHQINTFLHTPRLNKLGFPTMNILPHAPEIFGEVHRRGAEPFFAVLAMLAGTHFIRTHEVDAVARVREVMALYRGQEPA